MRLGIGMSGPQVAEGWHGRAWGRPNYRLRDTVAILRKVWSGERVAHDGKEIQLPYQGPGSSGLGKPIRNAFSPVAPIPILIGAETPLNVRMTGEIADGLITFEGEPKQVAGWRPLLEEGFARRGSRPEAFELYSSVRVLETDDVKGAIEAEKKGVAMYIGGFGASSINFHRDAMAAKGYPEAARRVQELFLAGRRDEAAEAVPDDYIDERMLIGAPARIRERFGPWRDSGFTTLAIRTGNPAANVDVAASVVPPSKTLRLSRMRFVPLALSRLSLFMNLFLFGRHSESRHGSSTYPLAAHGAPPGDSGGSSWARTGASRP